MADEIVAAMARLEGAIQDARDAYECWGCGEKFTFSPDWGVDMDGEPCPNRCGNLLVRA